MSEEWTVRDMLSVIHKAGKGIEGYAERLTTGNVAHTRGNLLGSARMIVEAAEIANRIDKLSQAVTTPPAEPVGSGVQGEVDLEGWIADLERAERRLLESASNRRGVFAASDREAAAIHGARAEFLRSLRTAPAETRAPDAELLDALVFMYSAASQEDMLASYDAAEALLRKHGRLPHTPEAS